MNHHTKVECLTCGNLGAIDNTLIKYLDRFYCQRCTSSDLKLIEEEKK